MKIAIIADPINNQGAGIHTYTLNLVREAIIHDRGHEIIIICEKRIQNLNCKQIIIPNTRLPIGWASLRLFFLVPLVCILKGVDIVVEPAHFGPFNLPQRIRRVTIIHDLTPLIFPEYHRWHSQILQRIFLKSIIRNSDLLVTNSKHTTADVVKFFPGARSKTHHIYLGIDPYYTPDRSRDLIESLPIDTSEGFFHFVGTLEPRKGLPTLVEAYDQFRSRSKMNVPLLICGGSGWKTEGIHEAVRSSSYASDIHLLGYVEQALLRQLHTHSIAMIYPSQYEGFGLPVAEALACGGSVITSDNSSLTEVGGSYALYAKTLDTDDLCQKMLQAAHSVPSEKEVNDRMTWARQFNWPDYVSSFLNLLESL